MFPYAANYFGLYILFWFYGALSIFTCTVAYFIMPETRGKTLTELATLYEKVPNESNVVKEASQTEKTNGFLKPYHNERRHSALPVL